MNHVFNFRMLMRGARAVALAGAWLVVAMGFAKTTEPEISVSPSGVSAGAVEQGEPWRVAVMLRADGHEGGSVELAPASGAWTSAVSIELWLAKGTSAAAKAEPVGASAGAAATLNSELVAGGLWRFSPEVMQTLAPGDYYVRSSLSIESGRGWTGAVRGPEMKVKIVAKRAGDFPERTANRAYDAVARGELREAAGVLDEALAKAPVEPVLLTARAVVSERAGDVFSAILCANAVQGLKEKTVSGVHPDVEFEGMQQRLRTALTAQPASGMKPPAWAALPPAVMTAIVEKAKKTPFVVRASGATEKVAALSTPARESVAGVVKTPTAAPAAPASEVTVAPAIKAAGSIEAAVTKPGDASAGVVVPAAELSEAVILADPNGQWAVAAVAGSEYSKTSYTAAEATGAPNVPKASDHPKAWCHGRDSKKKDEWLELVYEKPVRATEVRVRQSLNPGTIVKVEAIEADGTSHVWWEGRDQTGLALSSGTIAWFAVRASKPDYSVARIKLTLDLSQRLGWKQIDAVQLVGASE